ncbi:MAG: alpha/beta hydrolase [Ignavibacteriae bacterium]|nr:MAG: alpha/beta hydrolase [Ignavibacteriota bacterium]
MSEENTQMITTAATVSLHKNFTIACLKRESESGSTIVFLHGFGSSKEHFRYAFSSPSLDPFTLIAPDLIGFGQSRGPDDFGYSMIDQASIILEFLDHAGIGDFHLCAHSMGGLVGMHIAELEPQRVLSFVDLEGNLTREDYFFTGKVASGTFEEFEARGKQKFEKELREAGTHDPAMSEYADTFSSVSAAALYKSACHALDELSTPLIVKLLRIKNACYIYGDKNIGIYPGEKLLLAAGFPVFYIEHSGHAMAVENPGHLYSLIRNFIDRCSSHEVPWICA